MGAGADEGEWPESLATALDEVIVVTSALVVELSERGTPRERAVIAQLTEALVALAVARGRLAPGQGEELPGPDGEPSSAPLIA